MDQLLELNSLFDFSKDRDIIKIFFLNHSIKEYLYNKQIKQMGPAIVLAIQGASLVLTGVLLKANYDIESVQAQIKALIKDHQAEYASLKDLKNYFQMLNNSRNVKLEQDVLNQILKDAQQIQPFLDTAKKNLSQLINKYPEQFVGSAINVQRQTLKILGSYRPQSNFQSTIYLTNKMLNNIEGPSFTANSIQASRVKGFDLNYILDQFLSLLQTKPVGFSIIGYRLYDIRQVFRQIILGNEFTMMRKIFTFGTALFSVWQIFEIINKKNELEKLFLKKDQLQKQIGLLPKAEFQVLSAVKQIFSSYLMYLIISGDLIEEIRYKMLLISIFSMNKQLKQQFKDALAKIPNPSELITLETIKKIRDYVFKFQDLYTSGVNINNLKDKIIQTDQIFKKFLKQVQLIQLQNQITNTFSFAQQKLQKASQQFQKIKISTQFFQFVLKAFKSGKDHELLAFGIESVYLSKFKLDSLSNDDKLFIAQCVASVRQEFKGNDKNGVIYLDYKLADLRNNSIRYSDISNTKFNEENITQYQKNWVTSNLNIMIKQLFTAFPKEKDFKYKRSSLKFNGKIGQKFQVMKQMIFKGQRLVYKIQCGLERQPYFKPSIVVKNSLKNGQRMVSGEYLTSKNGQYYAIIQQDGDLVVYKGDKWQPKTAVWSSATSRKISQYTLIMQQDGNLVIYDIKWKPIWESKTYVTPFPDYTLNLLDDGVLVVSDQLNNKKWSSSTK